jgi:hypothetical protein
MSDDGRNRSQQILDEIFASEQFLEMERGWAEQAKREAARRREPKRPLLTAGISSRPDINMADLREHGTYRGKP